MICRLLESFDDVKAFFLLKMVKTVFYDQEPASGEYIILFVWTVSDRVPRFNVSLWGLDEAGGELLPVRILSQLNNSISSTESKTIEFEFK